MIATDGCSCGGHHCRCEDVVHSQEEKERRQSSDERGDKEKFSLLLLQNLEPHASASRLERRRGSLFAGAEEGYVKILGALEKEER